MQASVKEPPASLARKVVLFWLVVVLVMERAIAIVMMILITEEVVVIIMVHVRYCLSPVGPDVQAVRRQINKQRLERVWGQEGLCRGL